MLIFAFQAFTFNHIGNNVLHSYSEMISLWNQLVKNEIHLENNEQAKYLCFKIKSTKQEFNFTASYQNQLMVRKKYKCNFFDSAPFFTSDTFLRDVITSVET